jgi:hypothetical protein
MTGATPAEVQRLVAAAFDAQGWEFDLSTGPRLMDVVRATGGIDAGRLTEALPAVFFERNRVSKKLVATVIERAIGALTLKEEGARVPTTLVIGGSNYQMNVAAGASIVNSQFNLGEGTQIVAGNDSESQDVLLAVEAIVRAALSDEWNGEAAKALAAVIEKRPDVDIEDVQRVTVEAVKAQRPSKARARDLLTRIAASGLGGALATGITAGVGEALHYLPL